MAAKLSNFTDVLGDAEELCDSQVSLPLSLSSSIENHTEGKNNISSTKSIRPAKGTGQYNEFRSVDEIDPKYRDVFAYPFFNLVQSRVIEDALYSDKSLVVCAPTGSGKTVVFEMAVVQLLMEIEDKNIKEDFKIIYMAPVKALCTERLTEWYSKFTKLGLLCIEVTGDTDVDFTQLQAYRIIITTPEKWDMLTRRWRDHRGLVEMIKLFLIDEVHILNDESRGPVLEAVVSRMKTIQASAQSAHRIEKLQKQYQNMSENGIADLSEDSDSCPRVRFVAVSATVSNPEDVAAWLGTDDKPALYYRFGDECRPVKLRRVVEGYPCSEGTSIFKFDIILNYKLWPIIQKYHDGKPSLIFCNTRKSVLLTAETLSREITVTFSTEQKAKLTALASTIRTKKFQSLVLAGVGCHHAGMLFEERTYIEHAFRNGDLPILITTTTLAMGVNLPAHLVIIKNTQQYVNGAYQEYSISTVLQMVGRAGRPQFDTEATAVIMTRQKDKARYQALAGGSEPLQSYLHKRLAENLNSETALGTVGDVAQCVEWLRSTFLYVRAAKDPKKYLGLTAAAPDHLILKKVEELCVIAMNGLASAGLITMDDASCISSTEAGQLMSLYYLDLETMKHIMTIQGNESLERLVWIICECHELADMYLRTDERRILNALNRNNTGSAIRFPMKGKITTRQMKLSCIIQAILGCLPIPDPPLNQEAMKIMRIADRICKCLVAYVTRPEPITEQRQYFAAVLNSVILAKCVSSHLWENSPYVSKQLKGIGPAFSTLLASAGKVNFMLLEESHPRDLERIMNKGPPAGNVLRKQISLLPKYQLLATPVNEKTVSIKLQLLNQAYLAENVEHLTAGKTHKCYLLAGDSENHILMLRTFTDKDLMSVYDGGVTCEITRKHGFEHKILAHCISSKFAGIDVQCEYTFQNLMPPGPQNVDTSSVFFKKQTPENTYKQAKKQTTITDTFRERKRKNCNDEIVQSKEKRKRENALAEKFRLLKESFGRTSTNLREDLQKTQEISNILLTDLTDKSEVIGNSTFDHKNDANNINLTDNFGELNPDVDITDGFMYDANIDSILNEIESEITKKNITTNIPVYEHNSEITKTKSNNENNHRQTTIKKKTSNLQKKTSNLQKKTNYNFLNLVEKNMEISDEEDLPKKESGFSDTIKSQIEKYLLQSCKGPIHTEAFTIKELCEKDEEVPVPLNIINTEEPKVSLSNITRQCINLPESIGIEDITSEGEIVFDNTKQYKNTAEEIINFSADPDRVTNLEDGTYNLNQENYYKLGKEENIREKEQNDDMEFFCNKLNYNLQGESNVNTGIIFVEDEEQNPDIDNNIKNTVNNFTANLTDDKTSFNRNYELANQDLPQVSLNNMLNIPTPNNAVPVTLDEMNTPLALPRQIQDLKLVPTKELPSISSSNSSLTSISKMLLPTLPVTSPQTSLVHLYNISTSFSKNPQSSNALNKMPGWQLANQRMSILDKELTNVFDNISSKSKVQDVQNSTCNATTDEQSGSVMKMSRHQDNTNNKLELKNTGDKEYKDSYKFSAEKVDIHTEFTNDHQIHVIRRLRLDLDVKKIVSSLGNKKCNNTESTSKGQTENECDESRDEWELGNEQHIINTLSEHNYKITSNDPVDSVCYNEYKQLKKPYEMNDMELVKENMYGSSVQKNVNVDNENRTHVEHTPIAKENNLSNIFYGNSVQTNVNVDNENRTQIDHTSNAKENNVSNILQKFSRIMGKNKSCSSKVPIYQNVSSNCTTKMKPFKSRRPFRIREIQNIDVPLPTLCEGFKTINNVQETSASDLNPMISHFNRRTTMVERVSDFTSQLLPKEVEQQSCEQPPEHFRLTPCPSPEPLLEQALEISEDDLKLDQSMLNPKTMLQCIKPDDNAIIPPPPEFGDNDYCYSYSPDRTTDFKKDLITQPYYLESAQGLGYDDVERVHDISIFDGDSQSGLDLTPSKEIETWTLSREDEFESCLLTTPEQSNTVMHSKMLQNQIEKPFLNSFHGRHGRLSAFKFNRKSKLKM